MAYEKQTWQSGDIITAEKLNHIENGLEAIGTDSVGDMFVDAYRNFDPDTHEARWFLSKTYTEIHDYLVAGKGDVILRCDTSSGGGDNVIHMYLSQYAKSRNDSPIMFTGVEAGSNTTAVTSLTVHHFIILADGSVVVPSSSIIQITT